MWFSVRHCTNVKDIRIHMYVHVAYTRLCVCVCVGREVYICMYIPLGLYLHATCTLLLSWHFTCTRPFGFSFFLFRFSTNSLAISHRLKQSRAWFLSFRLWKPQPQLLPLFTFLPVRPWLHFTAWQFIEFLLFSFVFWWRSRFIFWAVIPPSSNCLFCLFRVGCKFLLFPLFFLPHHILFYFPSRPMAFVTVLRSCRLLCHKVCNELQEKMLTGKSFAELEMLLAFEKRSFDLNCTFILCNLLNCKYFCVMCFESIALTILWIALSSSLPFRSLVCCICKNLVNNASCLCLL